MSRFLERLNRLNESAHGRDWAYVPYDQLSDGIGYSRGRRPVIRPYSSLRATKTPGADLTIANFGSNLQDSSTPRFYALFRTRVGSPEKRTLLRQHLALRGGWIRFIWSTTPRVEPRFRCVGVRFIKQSIIFW